MNHQSGSLDPCAVADWAGYCRVAVSTAPQPAWRKWIETKTTAKAKCAKKDSPATLSSALKIPSSSLNAANECGPNSAAALHRAHASHAIFLVPIQTTSQTFRFRTCCGADEHTNNRQTARLSMRKSRQSVRHRAFSNMRSASQQTFKK